MDGGNGNDSLIASAGPDRFTGSTGTDTADYSAYTVAVSLSNDNLANDGAAGEHDKIDADVEIMAGGSGNDSIRGGAGSQTLIGNGGQDSLRGGAGDDSLIGGAGVDSVNGDAGADILSLVDGTADNADGGLDGDVDTVLQDIGTDNVINVP
jgi:Ca2+-binding RTX toxin-like protein